MTEVISMHEIFAEDAMANETNLKDLLKDPSLLATQGYLAGAAG